MGTNSFPSSDEMLQQWLASLHGEQQNPFSASGMTPSSGATPMGDPTMIQAIAQLLRAQAMKAEDSQYGSGASRRYDIGGRQMSSSGNSGPYDSGGIEWLHQHRQSTPPIDPAAVVASASQRQQAGAYIPSAHPVGRTVPVVDVPSIGAPTPPGAPISYPDTHAGGYHTANDPYAQHPFTDANSGHMEGQVKPPLPSTQPGVTFLPGGGTASDTGQITPTPAPEFFQLPEFLQHRQFLQPPEFLQSPEFFQLPAVPPQVTTPFTQAAQPGATPVVNPNNPDALPGRPNRRAPAKIGQAEQETGMYDPANYGPSGGGLDWSKILSGIASVFDFKPTPIRHKVQ